MIRFYFCILGQNTSPPKKVERLELLTSLSCYHSFWDTCLKRHSNNEAFPLCCSILRLNIVRCPVAWHHQSSSCTFSSSFHCNTGRMWLHCLWCFGNFHSTILHSCCHVRGGSELCQGHSYRAWTDLSDHNTSFHYVMVHPRKLWCWRHLRTRLMSGCLVEGTEMTADLQTVPAGRMSANSS